MQRSGEGGKRVTQRNCEEEKGGGALLPLIAWDQGFGREGGEEEGVSSRCFFWDEKKVPQRFPLPSVLFEA